MWQTLVDGIASLLVVFYNFTVSLGIPSYFIAIVIFTLMIKIVLFPLTYKQMTSMRKTQELQPQIQALQKKYKKSPEKANKAIMELYKENNTSPMSGCLPILVQMPVLIALFQALRSFQYEDLGASFLWIEHLQNPDPWILPLIVVITTFFSTKTSMSNSSSTGGAADTTNKTMMYVMPVFLGYMTRSFPAGLAIYWVFYSLFGIVQQLYVNKKVLVQKGEAGSQ